MKKPYLVCSQCCTYYFSHSLERQNNHEENVGTEDPVSFINLFFHKTSKLVLFYIFLTSFKKCQIIITSVSSAIKCQALCRRCNHPLFQTTARGRVSTFHSTDNNKLNKKFLLALHDKTTQQN